MALTATTPVGSIEQPNSGNEVTTASTGPDPMVLSSPSPIVPPDSHVTGNAPRAPSPNSRQDAEARLGLEPAGVTDPATEPSSAKKRKASGDTKHLEKTLKAAAAQGVSLASTPLLTRLANVPQLAAALGPEDESPILPEEVVKELVMPRMKRALKKIFHERAHRPDSATYIDLAVKHIPHKYNSPAFITAAVRLARGYLRRRRYNWKGRVRRLTSTAVQAVRKEASDAPHSSLEHDVLDAILVGISKVGSTAASHEHAAARRILARLDRKERGGNGEDSSTEEYD